MGDRPVGKPALTCGTSPSVDRIQRLSLSPERLARLKEPRRPEMQTVELAQQRQSLVLGFLWHMPGLAQHRVS